MAIKVQFEIGHSATVKSKPTPEGFTHDWELYVQGVNKADISPFVDKVVFNLHESFPKPKRSFKEPPYVLKESGYAGFVLAIDIFFRNRDEPKRVTYSYDLDLQQEGPPLHRSEVKKFIFEAPSEDFRQKLLKGGGIAVSGVVGGAITADEKSVDSSGADNRSQMVGKPKLSSDATSTSSSSSKKHKQRPDEKTNTFTNLFGTPINKTAPKFSPDPKTKTANGGAPVAPGMGKSGGAKDKGGSSVIQGNTTTGPTTGSGKEKEKSDKKDKHKQTSPNKEKNHDEKKKSDGKHEKRDEKKKDKKDKDKDRERNKDKASKRSVSPKSAAAAATSPKRPAPSPVRSSSAASRDDPGVKPSSKTAEGEKRTSGSSGGKKSKKEKKSHDKDREHKDKHRSEAKESIQAATTAAPVTAVPPAVATAPSATQPPAQASSKLQNPTVASKADLNSNKNPKVADKESKKSESSSKTADKDAVAVQAGDKKSSTEKDKKSHKHKKKDKNKEKEKDKDKDKDQASKKSTSSKEKKEKKEKTAKSEASTAINSATNAAATSKKSTETPVEPAPTESAATKQSSNAPPPSKTSKQSNNTSTVPTTNSSTSNSNTGTLSASGLLNPANDLSDVDNLNTDILHTVPNSNSEKAALIQNSDSSNSSFPELPPVAKAPTSLFQAPANPQPTPPPSSVTTTPSTQSTPAAILEPPRPVDKKDHKPHRGADKTKADKAAEKEDKKRRRNSTAVNTFVEPPLKQIKKDFNTGKSAREMSQSPLLRAEDKQTFLPPPATTSALPAPNTPVAALNLEYLSELQELHQKIMTLQDNEELQQVVEMIAATGRYEITSKTFDFDLCKLDRNTVQRLQDFFATSVS